MARVEVQHETGSQHQGDGDGDTRGSTCRDARTTLCAFVRFVGAFVLVINLQYIGDGDGDGDG